MAKSGTNRIINEHDIKTREDVDNLPDGDFMIRSTTKKKPKKKVKQKTYYIDFRIEGALKFQAPNFEVASMQALTHVEEHVRFELEFGDCYLFDAKPNGPEEDYQEV